MEVKNKQFKNSKIFYAVIVFLFYAEKSFCLNNTCSSFKRVVTLAPNLTKFVIEAGGENRLKGISFYSTLNQDRVILRVGIFNNPDLEKIISLKPDLVLVSSEGNPSWIETALIKRGYRTLVVSIKRLDDVIYWIKKLSSLFCTHERAVTKIEQYKKILKEKRCYPRRALLLIEVFPPWGAGKGTFHHDLLLKAGFENVLSSKKGYVQLNIERIISLKPEVIVIPESKRLNAILKYFKSSRILAVKDNDLLQPGPNLFKVLNKIKKECRGWGEEKSR